MYSADSHNDNKTGSRKVIGVMVNEISTDFSKTIIHGIANAIPAGKDIHLVILAGNYDDDIDLNNKFHRFNMIYNSIYKIGEKCRFDGFIFSLDGVGYNDSVMRGEEYFKRFGDIPMVLIASDLKNYVTVNYDNEFGIREAINCLVNVNGMKKICMLGGRDNHPDSKTRKRIFEQCLAENGIEFSEKMYEPTDLTTGTEQAAENLLSRNPGTEAVFCVNDAVAVGLYKVIKSRGLQPGKDIMVVGFDNTHMAEEMLPPLTSVGADSVNLGQKALELLLDMLDGEEVSSTVVKTRLYGRESFHYDMYEYNALELANIDTAFIYRMFDDCFYRYKNEKRSKKEVDLKRLFFEFISRMLYALKRRYISTEEIEQIERMIGIFFENNAMEYTDANKLILSIARLQTGMNNYDESGSSMAMINRLFLHMKDMAILSISARRITENNISMNKRQMLSNFVISSMVYEEDGDEARARIIQNFDKTGLPNAALCLFEQPIQFDSKDGLIMPEHIMLCCVTKNGELYILPEERRKREIRDLFATEDLISRCRTFSVFPLFYGNRIYGILICELTPDIYSSGEYIATQIGTAFYIAENRDEKRRGE